MWFVALRSQQLLIFTATNIKVNFVLFRFFKISHWWLGKHESCHPIVPVQWVFRFAWRQRRARRSRYRQPYGEPALLDRVRSGRGDGRQRGTGDPVLGVERRRVPRKGVDRSAYRDIILAVRYRILAVLPIKCSEGTLV